ncbi:MAG TPA: hypothetical protein VF210_07720 [Pseudomonadales bacterium]
MSLVTRLLIGVMALAVLYFGLQVFASEGGEVVVLYTGDDEQATRLWVVDDAGAIWLRSGAGGDSGWFRRLEDDPHVALERSGTRRRYLATPVPEMTGRINALMREKYGWRDRVISLTVAGREDAVAIRLVPE